MDNNFICVVCGKTLNKYESNHSLSSIYKCTEQIEFVKEIGKSLTVNHMTLFIKKDFIYKVIDVPPFSFAIRIEKDSSETIIREIKKDLVRKTILSVDKVIDFPWNNREKLMEKVKTYSLFA